MPGRGDPYPIDTLFLYMANMGWNSSMNTAETMRDAGREERRPATIASRISSIPTLTISETVAYADLILPDTTYLER